MELGNTLFEKQMQQYVNYHAYSIYSESYSCHVITINISLWGVATLSRGRNAGANAGNFVYTSTTAAKLSHFAMQDFIW